MPKSSISFRFDPHPQLVVESFKNLELVALFNGKELGAKYSLPIAVLNQKELEAYEEIKANPHKTVVLAEKYMWINLRYEATESTETWVKIEKSDLRDKFGLDEKEIGNIKKGKELYAIMSKKIKESLIKEDLIKEDLYEQSGMDKFITSFIKSMIGFFVLSPAIKKIVFKELQNKNPAQMEELYVRDQKKLLEEVKIELNEKKSKALKFFGDKILVKMIDEILISTVNAKLTKNKESRWAQNKLASLDLLRLLDGYQKEPDQILNDKQLLRINPRDMPLRELGKIPITANNKEALSTIWKHLIGNLYAKGRLNDLMNEKERRGIILQSNYAVKFLEAYSFIPEDFKIELEEEFQFNDQIQKINNFILLYSPLQSLGKELKIYEEKIKPKILELIKFSKRSQDVMQFLKFYIGEEEEIRKLANILSFNEDVRLFFTPSRIQALFFEEIERALVIDYHLTSTQLNNLKAQREIFVKEWNNFDVFNRELDACNSPKEIFNLLYFLNKDLGKDIDVMEMKLPDFPEIMQGVELGYLGILKLKQAYLKRHLALTKLNEMKIFQDLNFKEKIQFDDFKESLAEEVISRFEYLNEWEKYSLAHQYYNRLYRKTSEEVQKLLLTKSVINDVKKGENAPFLTSEQQKGLMIFDFIFNRVKMSQENISEEDAKKNLEFLENLKNDAKFIQALESMEESNTEESNIDQEIQNVLNNIPGFLHGIIKKNFSIPEKTKIHKIPAGISTDTINFLLEYIKTTKKMEKMERDLNQALMKADHLLEKYEKEPGFILKEEKLSLKELGILDLSFKLSKQKRFIDLPEFDFMRELEQLGLKELDSKLQNFEQNSKKATVALNRLEALVAKSVNEHYEVGDIFATNLLKKEKWHNKPNDMFAKVKGFFSNNLSHGGKLYKDAGGNITISHLMGEIEKIDFDLINLCVSDVWTLNLAPLVKHEMEGVIKSIYGKNWEEGLMEDYRKIENSLHLNVDKLKKLKNDATRRGLAGGANYPKILSFLTGEEVKGHERDYEKDLRRIHDYFFNDKPIEGEMICSEFVSKVTLASLIELNKQISKKLLEKYGDGYNNSEILKIIKEKNLEISKEVEDYARGMRHFQDKSSITANAEKAWRKILKSEGYNEDDIELTIRINNEEILDLPYSKKERLKAIHPGRMIQLLVDKKCAIKKGLPVEVSNLLDIE